MSKKAWPGFTGGKHWEIFIPSKHMRAHTLMVATGFQSYKLDFFYNLLFY